VRWTRQFSITLPNEMAQAVPAKVASCEYATESEVTRDGLGALMGCDQDVKTYAVVFAPEAEGDLVELFRVQVQARMGGIFPHSHGQENGGAQHPARPRPAQSSSGTAARSGNSTSVKPKRVKSRTRIG
jgi:hypothetical protein